MYAQRLMASADDSTRYDDTLERITALLQRFPQANTTSLQVMMLQADYNRAEALMAAWIGDPSQTAQRDQAKEILLRITPLLVQLQDQLNRQTSELLTALEEMPEGDALQAKEAELRRIQAVAARATYFAGWSNYYLGLAQQTPSNTPPYTTARDIFLKLLGIEDEALAELEAEWLGLESIWRARAVIGLGLSLAACGDLDGCAVLPGSGRCHGPRGDSGPGALLVCSRPARRTGMGSGDGRCPRADPALPAARHPGPDQSLRGPGAGSVCRLIPQRSAAPTG